MTRVRGGWVDYAVEVRARRPLRGERNRAVEHEAHVRDLGHVPRVQRLVERDSAAEHAPASGRFPLSLNRKWAFPTYHMVVTLDTFHLNSGRLNATAPENMPLQVGFSHLAS